MLLSLQNVLHYVQDRCLLQIESLEIFEGERIGLIGRNGVGKSTLLGILAGTIQPDAGQVTRHGQCAYLTQFASDTQPEPELLTPAARQLATKREYGATLSGGEQTRYRLAAVLGQERPLLLADEPTANLDIGGAELLQAELRNYPGAFVLVSHDRQLLDGVCNVIWELRDSRLLVYPGNYSDYLVQKEREQKHRQREYEQYLQEKEHLEQAVADRRSRSVSTKKTPKRMGNSEARLHKMGNQKAQSSLDKAVKAIETRLAKLEKQEKPKTAPIVNFQLNPTDGVYSKVVIRGERINKSFGQQVLFRDFDFNIMKGQKVALFGNNGCGKTTLLKMIAGRAAPIHVAPTSRLGYFAQDLQQLRPDRSILANVMADSVRDEGFARRLLAQLLFRRDDVYKKVQVLSGGELVRVALAQIIVSPANVLLLDEPTNFLDLPSLEALETVLAEYDGTIVFASHDRKFINKVASHLIIFDQPEIRVFAGNLEQYLQDHQAKKAPGGQPPEDRLVLEYRLTEVISRLSLTQDQGELARLDEEYRQLLTQLRS